MAPDKNSNKEKQQPSKKEKSPAGTETNPEKHQEDVDKARQNNNSDKRIFDL
ncbi:hypothetical protein [Bdellovibrio bacteriovorus]|uniref:hypothetical protein n=1 Tax=Bdellovibrio bacteriovorus TaxID=959 RepID=UPI0035A69D4A